MERFKGPRIAALGLGITLAAGMTAATAEQEQLVEAQEVYYLEHIQLMSAYVINECVVDEPAVEIIMDCQTEEEPAPTDEQVDFLEYTTTDQRAQEAAFDKAIAEAADIVYIPPDPEPAPDPPQAPSPPAAPNHAPPSGDGVWSHLASIRDCESGGNYQAVNPNGHFGAYQFSQSTWDSTTQRAGRPDLFGVNPTQASPADQDAMAYNLYVNVGSSQWACA